MHRLHLCEHLFKADIMLMLATEEIQKVEDVMFTQGCEHICSVEDCENPCCMFVGHETSDDELNRSHACIHDVVALTQTKLTFH